VFTGVLTGISVAPFVQQGLPLQPPAIPRRRWSTPEKHEDLLTMANALPRRILQKLDRLSTNELKTWTPFEGVPISISMADMAKMEVPVA
jgi:hypothetical protein